mmetsp:Transcript_4426/g.15388  ORF Transcript_4426/g.15388 Transcript_4426/m.15388 type:complete len:209 (+) Transcript_4426:490-1116(+)
MSIRLWNCFPNGRSVLWMHSSTAIAFPFSADKTFWIRSQVYSFTMSMPSAGVPSISCVIFLTSLPSSSGTQSVSVYANSFPVCASASVLTHSSWNGCLDPKSCKRMLSRSASSTMMLMRTCLPRWMSRMCSGSHAGSFARWRVGENTPRAIVPPCLNDRLPSSSLRGSSSKPTDAAASSGFGKRSSFGHPSCASHAADFSSNSSLRSD